MSYANCDNKMNLIPTDLISAVRKATNCTGAKDPKQLGPLVLAYIGDTIYDLFVRTELVDSTHLTAHGLHVAAAKRVCAKAQAEAFRRIEPMLTEDEAAVFRRGRNTHMGSVPKNAAIIDYRIATGMEALVGYLYLSGKDERLSQLMRIALHDTAATETQEEKNNN